jgi:RND family efflux transporter MFP subunit
MTRHAATVAALSLAAALPALGGCSPSARAATAREESTIPVRTAAVARGPIDRPVVAAGTVVTKDEWDLAFKVGGLLASVTVHDGQPVRRGQLLATLDPTELAAGVRQAREGLEKARRDAARAAQLAASEVAPRTAVEDARTAEALAEAQLEAAAFNLRHARLTAPDDGWVDRRLVEPGEVVAPGRPIVHLSGQGRGFVVRAALAERDVLGLRPGTAARVTLDASPDRALAGRVTEIARAAGRGTGTYQVEIALPAAEAAGLLSGLSARVEIARLVPAAGAVPLASVIDGDGDQGAIFTVRDGAAHRVPVRIAFLHGDRAVLSAGLDGVERVVTDGAPRLAEGTRVTESR